MSEQPEQNLSVGRNMKIGLFHLGSGMADVIITGVWNRVMISDLGYAATPVSLLTSLRYFLAPLGIWVGRISDRRSVGGFRRMFWIGIGRAMMVISTIMLGLSTASLVAGGGAVQVADVLGPFPRLRATPLADAEDDGSLGRVEAITHAGVGEIFSVTARTGPGNRGITSLLVTKDNQNDPAVREILGK